MLDSSCPLVSILTPSFNQGTSPGGNIASPEEQAYSRLEHIIMDGGSTGGSVGILRACGSPNRKWGSEPDPSQPHAIKEAFAESEGEMIGWLNADDAYFSAYALERVVRAFHENADPEQTCLGDKMPYPERPVDMGAPEAVESRALGDVPNPGPSRGPLLDCDRCDRGLLAPQSLLARNSIAITKRTNVGA